VNSNCLCLLVFGKRQRGWIATNSACDSLELRDGVLGVSVFEPVYRRDVDAKPASEFANGKTDVLSSQADAPADFLSSLYTSKATCWAWHISTVLAYYAETVKHIFWHSGILCLDVREIIWL